MPASATNKTNLGTVKTAIDALETNASGATGNAIAELKVLCKTLRREIARFEQGIQGLV